MGKQMLAASLSQFAAGVSGQSDEIEREMATFGVPEQQNRVRGRGAITNTSGRFESLQTTPFDDGWSSLEELPPFRTEIQVEKPKKIITRNQSPDISFDRSINPYRGCEHGCSYCFARPSHAYVGLSPGLDFETKLFAKPNAAQLLEDELSAPNYKVKTIAIGTNTDPYQPIEREYRIMRDILTVLSEANHPVGIVTKSSLVLRDLDILASMAERGLVKVALSVTSLDRHLSRNMEPRASTPEKRIDAIKRLSEAGVPTNVMVAPVIPALNDSELERILDAAAAMGAKEAGYILLRLPLEVSEIFKEWLLTHYPARYRHVLSVLKAMREGKNYESTWGRRMKGTGTFAWMIKRRFQTAARKFGLNQKRFSPRTDLFKAPRQKEEQLDLL